MDAKTIMVGLSLALKATALGLCVAIPTLMVYNVLLRRCDVLSNRYKAQKSQATEKYTRERKDSDEA